MVERTEPQDARWAAVDAWAGEQLVGPAQRSPPLADRAGAVWTIYANDRDAPVSTVVAG